MKALLHQVAIICQWITTGFVVGGGLLFGTKYAETRFFPPAGGFVVDKIVAVSPPLNAFDLWGTGDKYRDCDFRGLSAFALDIDGLHTGTRLPMTYRGVHAAAVEDRDSLDELTHPPGHWRWGPWRVFLDDVFKVHKIAIYARHSCHLGWDQVTLLGTIDLPDTK